MFRARLREARVEKLTAWFGQAREFLREVGVEMKKVTWPTRKETIAGTGVVLVMTLVMAAFFLVVDTILTAIVSRVL